MKSIDAGLYLVKIRCPRCEKLAEIPIELGGRLVVDDDGAAMGCRLKAKAVPHMCRDDKRGHQLTIADALTDADAALLGQLSDRIEREQAERAELADQQPLPLDADDDGLSDPSG
jgi:hypothetical protein